MRVIKLTDEQYTSLIFTLGSATALAMREHQSETAERLLKAFNQICSQSTIEDDPEKETAQ